MPKYFMSLGEMHAIEAKHLRGKLKIAIEGLEEIRDVALLSEGVEFYAMLAEKTIARIEGDE